MKRLLTSLLALTMLLSFSLTSLAEPSSWAETEVNEARAKGLVIPEADDNFQTPITRELFCKLIVKMVEVRDGSPVQVAIENPFEDTNDISVMKAYQLGIVKGVSATSFAPKNLITRQEIAIMMMRAFRVLDQLKGTSYTENVDISGISFADESSISDWALLDVKEANKLGLLKGVGGNKVDPLGNATIEQSIMLCLRLYKKFDNIVSVMPINKAPVPHSMYIAPYLKIGETLIRDASTFMYDPEGDTIKFASVDRVKPAASGKYQLIPAALCSITNDGKLKITTNSFEGKEKFNIVTTDGERESEPMEITVSVFSGNVPPEAIESNKIIKIKEKVGKNVLVTDIAKDQDGDVITYKSLTVSSPKPRTIKLAPNKNAFEFTSSDISNTRCVDFECTAVVTDGTADTTINFTIRVYGEDISTLAPKSSMTIKAERNEAALKNIREYVEGTGYLEVIAIHQEGNAIMPLNFGLLTSKRETIPIFGADNLIFYGGSINIDNDISRHYKVTVSNGIYETNIDVECVLKSSSP